ncbi:DNA helicase PcrA [Laedolimicola ammoniilytica]|uniref:ATP-dependent DNA helicase n=1 Tax=Laedolimicola ammoniilytica TaxID=2981771 RepID=A0ABT2RWW3_9FIRM|nr:DNA helicase PcrA [Laedolimicola ammoniilytica]MCU6696804.1 DNA helicase PcrA [Laedolimicola ammoniilytica]SCH22790.1 ATP-dependent DNA helicase pcrA [uncultured Clostridium sp.]SCH91461.1 ATP-dependent DNA helicase pcrA [uncultured Clostridium sp.]
MSSYDLLNPEQKEAVLHTEGPLLILAGAGSGKTRVLTHRVAYLIEQGTAPWNILAITFTNKAAGEMRERVDKLVGLGSDSIWVSTFHSTCVRILRRYIDRLGFDTSFSIYDTDDQKSVMKEVCKKLQIDTKVYRERMLLGAISHAKDELISPEQMRLDAGADWNQQKIAGVYAEYQAQLRKNNALDFDDLIMKTVELFRNCPDVLDYYQERFRYIMVDEYQDTNTAQFQLVSLLAAKYRNLCVVGDDDQSIYRFRGANIMNILNFEQVFPDAKVIKLEQNYRSTSNILNAANEVIHHNQGRKDKRLWTDNGTGVPVRFRQFQNAFEEAEHVVGNIVSHIQKEEAEYKDHAILYRTNAQSRLFEEKLIYANIPYKIIGGVNFYARKEIKDLLAYLKTVDNGRDEVAVRRIINVPKRGIGATTLSRVGEFAVANDMGFYEALLNAEEIPGIGRGASKVLPFTALIQTLRAKQEYAKVSELLETILEETGYRRELILEGTDESEARLENIDELMSKVKDYDENAENPSLSGFLEEVALVADIDNLEEESNHVVLMTLHSAKGLEFPYVYMVGMEDGLFPSYMSIVADNPQEEIEEERRLCYVGITRAKKELTLTAARQRMVRGEIQYNMVSRFVKEIPDEYLENKTENPGQRAKEAKEQRINQRKQAMLEARRSLRAKPIQSKMVAATKASHLDYGVGDRVKHIRFGEGTVLEITEGAKDYEVRVNFDTAGVKKLFASFAKLQKIY